MKKRTGGAHSSALAALGLPEESLGTRPQVLMVGQGCLRAQPCARLLEYTDSRICVKIGTQRLSVCGSDLQVRQFCGGLLELCGTVDGVLWEGEGQ